MDLGHDGVQAFRPASHDQVAHQGFQGRAVVVLGDGGALRRQGIGIAGPLADGLFVVRQAVVDAAVDIGLGLGGYEFCRQRVQDLDVGDARFHQAPAQGQVDRVEMGRILVGHVQALAVGKGLVGPFLQCLQLFEFHFFQRAPCGESSIVMPRAASLSRMASARAYCFWARHS